MPHGPFVERAPAKINLTLSVLGRRSDGYHELESLVSFAALADELSLTPGPVLDLRVSGPTGPAAGPAEDNLVLKAARALDRSCGNLTLGAFALAKHLPVAAGLGGGSSDAAAALRLLARANSLALNDPRLAEAARATGADVPVCLDPRPRLMRGVGDLLSEPLTLPRLPALLVNPGVALATREVFAALAAPALSSVNTGAIPSEQWEGMATVDGLISLLRRHRNDLEAPAARLQPAVAEVLAVLRDSPGCLLARMSGSGATCFGLYPTTEAAAAARQLISDQRPRWWVRATTLN